MVKPGFTLAVQSPGGQILPNHIGGRLPMRCVRSFQNQFDASFYRKQLFEIATFSFEFVAIVLVCSN